MASRLPSSNDAQDGATSQFPHTSPVPMETDDIELEAPTLAQQQNHPQNFMNPREATIEPIAADIYEDNDPRKLFGTSQLPLEREFEEQVSAVSAAKPVSSFISSNTPFHECETNVKQLVKRFENADESEREKGNGSVAKLKEDSPMTSIDLSLPAQRCSSVTENTSNCQKVSDRLSRTTSKKIHGDLEKEKENEDGFSSLLFPSPAIISETCSNQPGFTPPSQEISLEAVKTQVLKVKKEKIEWLQKENVKVREFGSTTKKSINILVLGQTGVGKSTWINALVNYLTYKTLDEAIAAEAPICAIPTKFTMFDDNYQRHDVHLGAHDNEVFVDNGQSATQSAKTYLCEQDEHNIYIIDTPGINDTRGHLKDEENIQNILRSIAPFKEIHAICFLFKANEARLTESFRYSIGKLLGNLSKTALNNACFVFTNARGTFYRPGDTMGPLKAYFNELKEKEGLSVRIDDNNIFCLDNEAFRFLCAHFSDIQFDTREIKTFADSWKHSSNEVQRLLDHAARARPHNTSDTLSINETRTWIYQLIDPILKACTMIQRNLQQLDWQKEELMQAENNVEELRRLAMIRVTSMEILRLSKPQTVCRSQKCARYERIDGKEALIYRVCHKDCYLDENGKLDGCAVFLGSSSTLVGVCTECSCHIYDHERIPYEQRITTKSLDNPQKLASETNAAEMKKSSIRKFERLINGYQKESNYILFAMATFSVFLAENGITQKTNLFEQHLQKLIVAEEKKMKSVTGVDADEFNRLLELSVTYEDICKQFVHQRDSVKISLDELQEIRQKLFSLPLNGAMIAQIFDIHVETNHQDYEATVTRCEKSMFQKIRGGVKKLFSIFGGSTK